MTLNEAINAIKRHGEVMPAHMRWIGREEAIATILNAVVKGELCHD